MVDLENSCIFHRTGSVLSSTVYFFSCQVKSKSESGKGRGREKERDDMRAGERGKWRLIVNYLLIPPVGTHSSTVIIEKTVYQWPQRFLGQSSKNRRGIGIEGKYFSLFNWYSANCKAWTKNKEVNLRNYFEIAEHSWILRPGYFCKISWASEQ